MNEAMHEHYAAMIERHSEMRVHRMSIVAICAAIATDGDVTDARMTALQLAWAMLQSAREADTEVA